MIFSKVDEKFPEFVEQLPSTLLLHNFLILMKKSIVLSNLNIAVIFQKQLLL